MSDHRVPEHANADPHRAARQRAKRALVALERRVLGQRRGVTTARVVSVLVGAAAGGLGAWGWRHLGVEASGPVLVAHATETVVWLGGWLAGLALSRAVPKEHAILSALAAAHGFDERAEWLAGAIASARIVVETVVPALVVAVTALVATAVPIDRASVRGVVVAGILAVLTGTVMGAALGAIAAVCRRPSVQRGRAWFYAVTIVPLLLSVLLPSEIRAWASLPAILHECNHWITRMSAV